MKKLSQKDLILRKLREQGTVSRNACIRGDYGQIITRLSHYILLLRKEGMDIETKEYENPKETEYTLKTKPKEKIVYRIPQPDGTVIVREKVIW